MSSFLAVVATLIVVAIVIVYLRIPIRISYDDKTTNAASTEREDDDFYPSATFAGVKHGFVFTTRDGITGYYRDHPPRVS